MSQYTELQELEAVLANQELLAFESWEMNSIEVYVSKTLSHCASC